MSTKHRRIVGVSVTVAVVLFVAATTGATTTYYRVTDLGLFEGAAGSIGTGPLNDYVSPNAGWIVGDVAEAFPSGHLISFGTPNVASIASFGAMSFEGAGGTPEVHLLGLTPLAPGDANADGLVNGADLAIWQSHYDPLGRFNSTFFTGDWNGDGLVNGGDLGEWQQNYTPIADTGFPYEPVLQIESVVPEPLTVLGIVLGLGSVGAYVRKRRLA